MKKKIALQLKESVTDLLAANITRTSYKNLPPEVVEATKREILDTLGLILVGSIAQGCPSLVSFAEAEGGKAESSILLYGSRVTATNAAMVNSIMAYAWDFSDTDDRTGNHVGAIAVPAALAIAERQGGIGGKAFITAIALGADLGCRLLLSTSHSFDGPIASTSAPFVAAATAGKILGLKKQDISHALGIAFAQVAFSNTPNTGPSQINHLKLGLGSRAGVLAALLAQKGLKAGTEDIFQGPKGFYQTFYKEEGNLEGLCSDLGKRFEVVNLSTKPYSCCRATHGAIDATLFLVKEHQIKPQEIKEVVVRLRERSCNFVGGVELAIQAIKRQPRFTAEAQHSIYWTLATGLVKGRVFVDSFTEEGLKDSEIRTMAQKIKAVADPELSRLPIPVTLAIVEIKTEKGATYSRRVELARGNPAIPWSWEETEGKFWECARLSAHPLTSPKLKETVDLVRNLEQVGDISVLAGLLSTPA